MTPEQALAAKEVLTRQALYEVFGDDPETIKKIDDAFNEAGKGWEPHLTATYGKTETQQFLAVLKQ